MTAPADGYIRSDRVLRGIVWRRRDDDPSLDYACSVGGHSEANTPDPDAGTWRRALVVAIHIITRGNDISDRSRQPSDLTDRVR
jgi:hypothetical protein